MAYTARSKDNALDNGRAADQNESVDNDAFLYAGLIGPAPSSGGGIVRQFVKKSGMADNVATEVFTITTTNEAGNTDGGSYHCVLEFAAIHGAGSASDNAIQGSRYIFSRAMTAAGAGQNSTAYSCATGYALAESEGGTTKGIVTTAMTVVETSEYVMSCKIAVDLDGTTITTATVIGMVTLYYHGFLTPPVITSAE